MRLRQWLAVPVVRGTDLQIPHGKAVRFFTRWGAARHARLVGSGATFEWQVRKGLCDEDHLSHL